MVNLKDVMHPIFLIIYIIQGVVQKHLKPCFSFGRTPKYHWGQECTTLANMAYLIEHKARRISRLLGEDGDAFHAMNLGLMEDSVGFHTNGDEMHEMFQAIEHNEDIKRLRLSNVNLSLKSTLFLIWVQFLS